MKDTKIDDNLKKILNESLGERLKILLGFLGSMCQKGKNPVSDLELLKEAEKDLAERLDVHDAIGFMNPSTYESKSIDGKARLKRVRAIINLLETLIETEKELLKAKDVEAGQRQFEEEIGRIL